MSNQQKEIQFGWFLPTAGDGKYVGVAPERKPTLDYLIQVAQAAEHAGFGFVLIPTGGACMDAWVVGSAVMSHTKTLRPLVAVRPGLTAPVLAARMAAALDILSEGRAMINVVTGSSVQDLEELGDPLAHAHDERYERAREYLEVMTRAWTQSGGLSASEFTRSNIGSDPERQQPFVGKYYQFQRPVSTPLTVQKPYPPSISGAALRLPREWLLNMQIHSSCGASRMPGFKSKSRKSRAYERSTVRKRALTVLCAMAFEPGSCARHGRGSLGCGMGTDQQGISGGHRTGAAAVCPNGRNEPTQAE